MSDVSQGPGWWLASDGKWYPPELAPGVASSAESDAAASGQGQPFGQGAPVGEGRRANEEQAGGQPGEPGPSSTGDEPNGPTTGAAGPSPTPDYGVAISADYGPGPAPDSGYGYGPGPAPDSGYGYGPTVPPDFGHGYGNPPPGYGYGTPGGYAYPAAPPYGAPYGAYAYGPPRNNGLAIAAMVCSFFFWVYGLGGVLGIVFGFIARSQIRRSRGAQKGAGMALAGIIVSIAGLGLGIIGIVIGAIVDHHCHVNGTC